MFRPKTLPISHDAHGMIDSFRFARNSDGIAKRDATDRGLIGESCAKALSDNCPF